MKVLFLINHAFGIGGTIRTTFNSAAALADLGHDVTVLSTLRRRDTPPLPADPRIKLMALVEMRKDHPDYDAADPLRSQPAQFYPKADYRAMDYNAMVEDRCRRYLQTSDADVVIATRAGLIAYVAQFAPERMVRIGQEHLTRTQQRKAMRAELPRHLRGLDAFVTVTAADASDYRRHTNLPTTRILHIPNSVPKPQVAPSHGRARIVVAAGRLVEGKRYDLLVGAFAKVVAEHPDWQLRLYGEGQVEKALRTQIVELGLHNNVLMMGPYAPIEPEWAKGSIAAVPSDREPFGMTLVEAMRCGVPVVSTDAPLGPREILDDGVDGLLTPVGDVDAMADALLKVIGDPEKRHQMAAAALADSDRFDLKPIAERYVKLFEELAAAKRKPRFSFLRRKPAAVEPPPVLGPAATLTQATVGCVVDADGSVRLTPTTGDTSFVWRPVGGREADGVPQEGLVVRPGDLAEGVWQLWTTGGTEFVAGNRDTRALVDFEPAEGAAAMQLPFRTDTGGLGLRVWRRKSYAEVAEVQADDGLHLTGRLVGTEFAGEPVLELLGPGSAAPVPVQALSGRGWKATVPVVAAGTWELWLRPAGDARRVRVGRVLDDVISKSRTYVLPAVVSGTTTMQPFYTAENEFSVVVTA